MSAPTARQQSNALGDRAAWLEHAAGCDTCYRVRVDILALRRGEIERSVVTLACPVGIRIMPLADVDVAAEPPRWRS